MACQERKGQVQHGFQVSDLGNNNLTFVTIGHTVRRAGLREEIFFFFKMLDLS